MGVPRVWVISELYYPEDTSTGYFLTKIAEGLAERYPVNVLCGQPTYSARAARALWSELYRGVEIRRCWSTTLNKDFLPFRVLNMMTLSVSVFLRALWSLGRGDLVLVVTNPPLLPFLIMAAGRLRQTRVLLLIHDVYPEVLIAAKVTRAGSLPSRALNCLNRWLYRSADQVIVLGRDMYELVMAKLGKGQPPVIIPNWADTDEIRPVPRDGNSFLGKLDLMRKFVVLYSGNMGRTHGLQDIVECAQRLISAPEVHFLLIGSGAGHRWLKETLRARELHNVSLLDRQPREQLNNALNAGDVAIISFLPGMAGVSVPSRMYNLMAAGKAIIAVADTNSELAMVIREEGIGWVVTPGDNAELHATILAAKSAPERLAEMGRRARRVAEEKYSFSVVIGAYHSLIERVSHAESRV